MTEIIPAYYDSFRCIASACRHCCCIGWEIDIDGDTAEYYAGIPGELGKRLRENITPGAPASFRLDAAERCPFLNGDNLCELILALGEESLCDICTEHPRFHNWYDDRVESGLGLCCEAAAALIMGEKEPFAPVICGPKPTDTLFGLRERVLQLFCDRSMPLSDRCGAVLALCGGRHLAQRSPRSWIDLFRTLEQMQPDWTDDLCRLADGYDQIDFGAFSAAARAWETEYEQLLCYFIYRHFLNMAEEYGPGSAAGFAALSCSMIFALQAAEFQRCGSVNFETRADIARRYSAEIEYSDENPQRLLEALQQK